MSTALRSTALPTNPWVRVPTTPPFILPEDAALLHAHQIRKAGLQLHELPRPFSGDPRTARVLLLTLNPGYDPRQVTTRAHAAELRLGYTFQRTPPYFGSLDNPELPGREYWRQRLRVLSERVGSEALGQHLAQVQWFPYCSATFTHLPFILPSQRFSFDLVAQAARRGALIIMLRGRGLWLPSVPELAAADVIGTHSPRCQYVTPGNLGAVEFARVCRVLCEADSGPA